MSEERRSERNRGRSGLQGPADTGGRGGQGQATKEEYAPVCGGGRRAAHDHRR
jgi:hypothetical protein